MPTFTASDGTTLVFSRWGSPLDTPAVVVPGGPARGVEYLEDLAGVAHQRALVVLHPRGTPSSGGTSRGWWHDATDVIDLLDALRLDAADLVAHSAGTRVALATAVQFPARVRSLTLITPAASWLTGGPHDGVAIGLARHDSDVSAALVAMQRIPASGQADFDRHRVEEAPAGYAQWGPRERAHAELGAWAWDAAATFFTNVPDDAAARVRAARLPRTWVISGREDILSGREPVRAYAEALGAVLREIDGSGHYPWVEQPAAFRAFLIEALRAGH